MRRLLVWGLTFAVIGAVVYLISTPHSERPCIVTKPGACAKLQRQGSR